MDPDNQGTPVVQKIPKRARSAYILFAKSKVAELIRLEPELHLTTASKRTAESWISLSDEEKLPYQKQALLDKDRFLSQSQQFAELGWFYDENHNKSTN